MTKKFFWVNHKQTYMAEISGNYIWSPKREVNGAFNQSYENLTFITPGDVVFSFANGEISAVGYACSGCYEAPKPGGFANNWASVGWKVDIDFIKCDKALRPKDYINEFKDLLPRKYSPMNTSGNGNQKCYLAEIGSDLAQYLFSKLNLFNDDLSDFHHSTFPLIDDLSETVREAIVLQRVGQNLFRKKLLEIYHSTCALTRIQLPVLLRASHIKPWAQSNSRARLDPANGILLAAHIDVFFDKGLISFDDKGNVLMANETIAKFFYDEKIPYKSTLISADTSKYLQWHRDKIFKG